MEVTHENGVPRLKLSNSELADLREALFPHSEKDSLNIQLNQLDFDFDVLRIMVNTKRRRLPKSRPNDEGFQALSEITGIADTSLRNFCHGNHAATSTRTLVRLMAWVGYTDLAEFLKEE